MCLEVSVLHKKWMNSINRKRIVCFMETITKPSFHKVKVRLKVRSIHQHTQCSIWLTEIQKFRVSTRDNVFLLTPNIVSNKCLHNAWIALTLDNASGIFHCQTFNVRHSRYRTPRICSTQLLHRRNECRKVEQTLEFFILQILITSVHENVFK